MRTLGFVLPNFCPLLLGCCGVLAGLTAVGLALIKGGSVCLHLIASSPLVGTAVKNVSSVVTDSILVPCLFWMMR